uniref:Uncharacterized protein n=1 Tax=Oryza meridionalis TaxID=40149 RepID=A0A0E0F9L3_9ORYZ
SGEAAGEGYINFTSQGRPALLSCYYYSLSVRVKEVSLARVHSPIGVKGETKWKQGPTDYHEKEKGYLKERSIQLDELEKHPGQQCNASSSSSNSWSFSLLLLVVFFSFPTGTVRHADWHKRVVDDEDEEEEEACIAGARAVTGWGRAPVSTCHGAGEAEAGVPG